MQQPLSTPLFTEQVSELTKQLQRFTTTKEKVTYSTSFLLFTGVLAVASAAIFFFSAQKASDDYVALLPENAKEASFVFEWVAPICVAVTNIIFNHEVFLDLWGKIEKILPAVLAYVAYVRHNPVTEANAWIVSAATILPFWYISIGDSFEFFTAETISSILCLFVFYNGAETFYQVLAYPSIQLLWLNIELLMLHSIGSLLLKNEKRSAMIADCSERIKIAKNKALLVAALEDKYYTFYYSDPKSRELFVNHLKSPDTEILKALLEPQVNIMPHIPSLVYQSTILLFIKFVIFAALAMEQNFGHAIESYKAGAELYPVMGVVLAIFNLVPSIGFTIKGILGYGPVEMFLEIGGWRQSGMQQFAPGYYRLIWLMRFSDFFSGFSNNAVNTIGAKDCGASDQVAFGVGLAANIGTVFGFNGPQAELWFQTNIMEWLLAKDLKDVVLVQQNLREFVKTIKHASLKDVDDFITDKRYAETINAFFTSKDSKISELLDSKRTNANDMLLPL